MTRQTIVITIIRVVAAISVITAAFMLAAQIANAWEGDDGGLDNQEVEVGRWVHHENVELWRATEQANIDAYRAAAEAYAEAVRLNNQQQLTTPPSAPRSVWDQLAQCESGGNWSIHTGTYDGGLQFLDSTWDAQGGEQFAPTADQATREEQIIVAERLLAAVGNYSPWPACARKLGLPR